MAENILSSKKCNEQPTQHYFILAVLIPQHSMGKRGENNLSKEVSTSLGSGLLKEMVSMVKNFKWISVGTCFVFSLALYHRTVGPWTPEING